MTTPIAISIVGLLVAVGGFLATYFGFVLKLYGKLADTNERLATVESEVGFCKSSAECLPEIKKDLVALTEQSRVYWEVIAPRLRDIIHSPIHKTRDTLVDELLANRIDNLEDAKTLESELRCMLERTTDTAEILAASVFLARVEWLKRELEGKTWT